MQQKYTPVRPIALPDRRWPANQITTAPRWLSTDLRDGNQALFEPMTVEQKIEFFAMLVAIGFKEIEVAFPSASQTEFDFVRRLIEEDLIPADVTIGVLTQARAPLIRRTFEALTGIPQAIVHVYNATSPVFRETVFGLSEDEVVDLATEHVALIRACADAAPATKWTLEYSPETFSATELPFALRVCDAVTATWDPNATRPLILNLPATVEVSMPNVYADQVEWMHRHLARRADVVLSVHPHNDRGTGVAAAELALLAGADRVEGCLFGNGERTGNADLVTLALNMHTQGLDSGLNFSQLERIARTAENYTGLPVHPRHPYAGDLVFTAFSGSHQDAIKKGLAVQSDEAAWQVPYLPIDPADIGRSYASLIRVNSQSGKGGIAYLLEAAYGLVLPRRLQVEFSSLVQAACDASGQEMTADTLWALFEQTYLNVSPPQLRDYRWIAPTTLELCWQDAQGVHVTTGTGNGPLSAACAAWPTPVEVLSYEEHSLGKGAHAQACAFVEVKPAAGPVRFGVGLDTDITTAALKALLSALAH